MDLYCKIMILKREEDYRCGRGEYGSNTPLKSQGVFEPYSPLTRQGGFTQPIKITFKAH